MRRASRILFDGTRATGVRYVDDRDRSTVRQVFARKEVIVSGGTANTAKLLQISGVGPAGLLQDLGVPVVADLPVGENFRDHYAVRIVARVKNIQTINEMARGLGLAGQIARWALGRPSILAVSPSLVHWFWNSENAAAQPDIQGVFQPGQLQARVCRPAGRLSRHDRGCLAASARRAPGTCAPAPPIRSRIRRSSQTI